MGKLFGTDGVRGIANRDLTCQLSYKIGRAKGYVLKKNCSEKPLFLIAKDTRLSCDMIESALTAGILSQGANVMQLGVLPTPAVAYLVKHYGASAGVMISASHNPAEYNGIKFFDSKGLKLSDALETQIEELVREDSKISDSPPNQLGKILPINNPKKDYLTFLASTVSCDFKNLHLAIDCANGATVSLAEELFTGLGATVTMFSNQPDGLNINRDCGSTHLNQICHHTVKAYADLGISFDGDGDRVLLCDESGKPIDGDQILSILAHHMKSQGKLPKNTVVSTVMSNLALSLFGKENDITVKQTKVGDRYVLEEMLSFGYHLGGEQSGHIILRPESTTGDGLLTALKILEIMKQKNSTASQLASVMTPLPQILLNITVQPLKKEEVLADAEVQSLKASISHQLGNNGRILLRASGTEPVFRVMLEGKSAKEIGEYAHKMANLISQKFGEI